ncbi:MAG TPA: Rrf2 family transcriptional regulator [Kiritimatiellia bacterium]|nr:Rrf2 family transcriptional regulator [Kiritimatiellia bacterium]HMP00290.1 Rrf2 family transcriptional regulator [Kiritimatiellia bacterium]
MTFISKSCEYSLRAALYIAAQEGGSYVSIKAISKELGISFHFLTKLLQKLTEHGLLKSYRGPSGGVTLAKPAKKISLYDIIVAQEEGELFSSCVLGLAGCGARTPCPLHKQWMTERKRLEKMFKRATLDKLAVQVARGELRLAN